jgi:hypothetical protein
MSDLHAAARALGGRVVAGWVRFAPPGHSQSDDSGAIDPASDGGIRVKSFSPKDDPKEVRDFVRARLGINSPDRGAESRRARSRPSPPIPLDRTGAHQAAASEAFLITPSAPRADLNDLFLGAHRG